MKLTKKEFEKILKDKVVSECGVTLDVASAEQIYRCMAMIVRQIMSDRQKQFQAKTLGEGKKQVYYLCMEFLMGRSLRTSLFNLGLNEVAEQVLADADIKIDTIYEQEPDAGLGNGGLGRLAACYLDGMATDCIPGTGYSILYEYGIFKQKIVDGWQQETADNWLPGGQVWIKSHPDQAQEIRFDGQAIETWEGGFHHVKYENYNSVIAVPNDMYVAGYGTQGVSKLRLWQAKAPSFDMSSFNAGNYNTAISQSASAELISKILYPNDNHTEGKILRLRQQYFFSAASVADILGNHLNQYGTLDNLADKVAIQLNDTHPTVAIPEMMRILLDECGFDWDKAFSICQKVFSYTNHTVMAEALEKWNVDIFKMTLPRIYQIVVEMDRRAREELAKAFPGDQGKIDYMALIGDNQVRMANICAYTANSINGVSKLHSEIIKDSVFHDYFLYKPKAFKNVTNGIAYRRWLLAANPGLTKLLEDSIGPGFKQDASELKKFEKFADDSAMLDKLAAVKRANKVNFANYLEKATGQVIDPDSIFDCQVKRMHEYKRQHLNAMNIAAEYLYLKANPNADFVPKKKGENYTVAAALDIRTVRQGHIEIVGAGPGDPDLVSVRGRQMLERADLILYAGSLVPRELTLCAKAGATVLSSASMDLEEQFEVMKKFYDKGKFIVRLHTGDPCIYGAIQEQMNYFDQHGMSYHITPGISSFQAAAAALKSQFTIPEKVQSIILTRGEGRTPMPEREKLHLMARSQSTMCIFLSASIAKQVQEELLQEYPETTPVAVCYHLTWKDEQIFRGELKDLARIVKENNLTLTTMIVVGEAIGNREGLSRLYAHEFKHLYRK